jgi:uncharacterized membrane protein
VNSGGGVFGALFLALGLLLLFVISFGFFLILPFFIFLGGIIAVMISDRKRGRADKKPKPAAIDQTEPETGA